jgi:hypothetical protein
MLARVIELRGEPLRRPRPDPTSDLVVQARDTLGLLRSGQAAPLVLARASAPAQSISGDAHCAPLHDQFMSGETKKMSVLMAAVASPTIAAAALISAAE